MLKIIIVEGDSPEQLIKNHSQGLQTNSELYSQSLKSCRRDLDIRVIHPYSLDFSLDTLHTEWADGFVFTGSNVNWSVDDKAAKPQQQVMEKALQSSIPVLGSCNGLQLGMVVLGGSVRPSPNGLELGLASDIRLTDSGSQHQIHKGRISGYVCPCIHRDEVAELPQGAVLTATNDHSPVQAAVFEQQGISFWGMQYHPEISAREIADFIAADGLFTGSKTLVEQLRQIEKPNRDNMTNAFKVPPQGLIQATRTLEISNWLTRLEQQA